MDDVIWEKVTFFFGGTVGSFSWFVWVKFGGRGLRTNKRKQENTENKIQNTWRSPEEKGGKSTFEKVVSLRMEREREGEWWEERQMNAWRAHRRCVCERMSTRMSAHEYQDERSVAKKKEKNMTREANFTRLFHRWGVYFMINFIGVQ